MAAANRILLVNSLLCPPLGFLLNFLLLWLILHRTPKEMAVHSRVLLQTCLVDCLLLALQTVAQNITVFDQQHFLSVIFFDGYLVRIFPELFSSITLVALPQFWLLFIHISICGLSAQFLYRYLVLNRNKKVSLCQYLMLLAVPISCVIIAVIANFLSAIQTTLDQPSSVSIGAESFANIVDFDQKPLFYLIVMSTNSTKALAYFLIFLVYVSSYVVVFFCGFKMVAFVRNHAAFNPRLKELNRQLTKNLILLAVYALLTELLSGFQLMHAFTQMGRPGLGQWMMSFNFYLFLAFHWLPVLNPVVGILTNRPYLEALMGRRHNAVAGQTIIVTPMSVAHGHG